MVDGPRHSADHAGDGVVIDGTKLHQGRPLEWERYATIAFLHAHAWQLNHVGMSLIMSQGYPLGGNMTSSLSQAGEDCQSLVQRSNLWDEFERIKVLTDMVSLAL